MAHLEVPTRVARSPDVQKNNQRDFKMLLTFSALKIIDTKWKVGENLCMLSAIYKMLDDDQRRLVTVGHLPWLLPKLFFVSHY